VRRHVSNGGECYREYMVREVKGIVELCVSAACRGVPSRGNRRSEIEVDPKRRGL